MDASSIRRTNFLTVLEQHGGVTRVAEKFDCSKSYISQLKRSRQMGSKTARKLESLFGMPHGWMDTCHQTPGDDVDMLARMLSSLSPQKLQALKDLAGMPASMVQGNLGTIDEARDELERKTSGTAIGERRKKYG